MKKHWIIKKAPTEQRGRMGKVATSDSGNNCYPSVEAALKQAEKLAENLTLPQYVVYEAVQHVGAKLPNVVTSPIIERPWHEDNTTCEDPECPSPQCALPADRYSCKSNNCEDTECQRCFPTSRS